MDWRRHRENLVQLWAGAGLDDLEETTMHNLVELFGDPRLLSFVPPEEKKAWSWMVDEIAINPVAGYHRGTKKAHGFCYDHSSGVSFSATSKRQHSAAPRAYGQRCDPLLRRGPTAGQGGTRSLGRPVRQ
mmetsp:Transcript_41942/g.77687  ORF Transcript_41942/g.77687 Transcript_41942/m.77687 type:complete len:130 (-) Transcript_41942:3-392(-)